MKREYPYLLDEYFTNNNSNNKVKRSILQDIKDYVNQRQYIRLTLLDWNENPIREIQGEVSSGSLSKVAQSPVRRSGNLSVAIDAGSYSIDDAKADFAINKKIYIELGVRNETKKYPDYPIFWFPEGVFFIGSFSINSSSGSTTNISITIKDKMAMLNGEIGGKFPSVTYFDSMDTQLPDGTIATKKVLIFNIIQELVHHFGKEPLTNIVIENVPLRIRRVLKWTGSSPLYMIYHLEEKQGTSNVVDFEPLNMLKPTFTTQEPAANDVYEVFYAGDDIGYIRDDFVVTNELVGNAGETVTSILDKIVSILGNYEYFYDVFGTFHFREIQNYMNHTLGEKALSQLTEKDYLVDPSNSKSVFTFSDESLLTSITVTPLYENIKNDYVIDGLHKNEVTGIDHAVRYHLVIDEKPELMAQDKRTEIKKIRDREKDLETLRKVADELNSYLWKHQEERRKAGAAIDVLKQRKASTYEWITRYGDEVKKKLTLTLGQFSVPDNQNVRTGDFKRNVFSEKDFYENRFEDLLKDIKKQNKGVDLSYYLNNTDKLMESMLKQGAWRIKHLEELSEFTERTYECLTPEGYWRLIRHKGRGSIEVTAGNKKNYGLLQNDFLKVKVKENNSRWDAWNKAVKKVVKGSYVRINNVYYYKQGNENKEYTTSTPAGLWTAKGIGYFSGPAKSSVYAGILVQVKNDSITTFNPGDSSTSTEEEAIELWKKSDKNRKDIIFYKILGRFYRASNKKLKSSYKTYYFDPTDDYENTKKINQIFEGLPSNQEDEVTFKNFSTGYTKVSDSHIITDEGVSIFKPADNACEELTPYKELPKSLRVMFGGEYNEEYMKKIYSEYYSSLANKSDEDTLEITKLESTRLQCAKLKMNDKSRYNAALYVFKGYPEKGTMVVPPLVKSYYDYDINSENQIERVKKAGEYSTKSSKSRLQKIYKKYEKSYLEYKDRQEKIGKRIRQLRKKKSPEKLRRGVWDYIKVDYDKYIDEKKRLKEIEKSLEQKSDFYLNSGTWDYATILKNFFKDEQNNPPELVDLRLDIPIAQPIKDGKIPLVNKKQTVQTELMSLFQVGSTKNTIENVYNNLIKKIQKIIEDIEKYPNYEYAENPHYGDWYYDVYTDDTLILYEEEDTDIVKAGFVYTVQAQTPEEVEMRPSIGNVNLLYGPASEGDTNYYYWNGTEYRPVKVKGVYRCEGDYIPEQVKLGIETDKEKVGSAYYIYDWRTYLYLQGVQAKSKGSDQGHYFEELDAFWSQTYDLVNQWFHGQAKDSEQRYDANRLTSGYYFLDFLDSTNTTYGRWSVNNIGRRCDVVHNEKINCLFEPEIPNFNLFHASSSGVMRDGGLYCLEDEWTLDRLRKESMENGEPYVQIDDKIYNNIVTGGYRNSAYEQLKYELYMHTRYQKTISMSSIPVFYLEPNSRISISDKTTNTFGDFVIQSVSLTFGPGANMSISANEILERF